MTRRLLLIRHAPTPATRARTFPRDEPLDAGGRAAAARLGPALPHGVSVSSPARRCLETAAALGLTPRIDARLAECDFGVWSGRALADLDAEDSAATRAWMTDPSAAPHHGESLLVFHARVGTWLADTASRPETLTIAITHGGVIRSALTHAHHEPPAAMWRRHVAPLAIVTLLIDHRGRLAPR